ncbi:MAG: release factor glutamine methyltransferase [Solirubrobacteraceae bacterium]|nr:release factor glutamine methyltransferase [Solirubrobacteraceae bacterium]
MLTHEELTERLTRAGFVAAEEEAAELLETAAGDDRRLQAMLDRRLTGEPLAWIAGWTAFCGLRVGVDPGVYVPRWMTELLAERAVARLPGRGVAIDVCCGSGAVAAVLAARRPGARVVATDVDPRAVACAARNASAAFETYAGDLLDGVPADLRGGVDVLVGVVPYVPTGELRLLQRDTLTFETPLSYDGGPDGCALLRRVVAAAPDWLRPGGALLLELGGAEADALDLSAFTTVEILVDEDGDVRGVEATR